MTSQYTRFLKYEKKREASLYQWEKLVFSCNSTQHDQNKYPKHADCTLVYQ